jgi:Brp/Blh family beta-carotene 15,15'-monooxygenase
LWAAVVVFVSDLLILSARRDGWIAARLAVFALAFALLPVLVSFGLFFCGWHSVRELVALARQACPTRPWRGFLKVVRLAAPRAALAVMATAGAAWWFAAERALTSVVAQAVFLGLSAVAVPHILLHAAANRLRANPFARENDWCPTAVIT